MTIEPNLTEADYELLSAYIDRMLSEAEQAALEARLSAEPELRRELNTLRQTVGLLNKLPPLKAPRDFTLSADMAGIKTRPAALSTPRPVIRFPTISLISAAAAILFILFGAGILLLNSNQSGSSNNSSDAVALRSSADVPSAAFANTGELSTAERLTASAQQPTFESNTPIAPPSDDEAITAPGDSPQESAGSDFSSASEANQQGPAPTLGGGDAGIASVTTPIEGAQASGTTSLQVLLPTASLPPTQSSRYILTQTTGGLSLTGMPTAGVELFDTASTTGDNAEMQELVAPATAPQPTGSAALSANQIQEDPLIAQAPSEPPSVSDMILETEATIEEITPEVIPEPVPEPTQEIAIDTVSESDEGENDSNDVSLIAGGGALLIGGGLLAYAVWSWRRLRTNR